MCRDWDFFFSQKVAYRVAVACLLYTSGSSIPEDYFEEGSNNDVDQMPLQSRDFIAAKNDKFVLSKLPDRMEKQIGYTCVTSIISFIELTLGGKATYDSNGVLKTDHGAVLQEYINYRKELDVNLSLIHIYC